MNPKPPDRATYDKNRLFSYALWYTGKYRVSRARLLEKLNGKCDDSDAVSEIMAQLAPYHSDEAEIRSFMDSCLTRSKPLRYVKDSLRRKKFDPGEIDSALSEYGWFDDYDHFSKAIESRIRSLVEKGAGPRWIESDLVRKYPQFSQEIHIRCQGFDEIELLRDFLRRRNPLAAKWILTGKDGKKIHDDLVRKGYSYDAVRKCMQTRESEPED